MINLFIEYYRSSDPVRQQELEFCLQSNLANPCIDRIFLFISKDDCEAGNEKLRRIYLSCRLKYSDFFSCISSESFTADNIFILANSDIYFDHTISLVKQVDLARRTMCLTRYEGNTLHHPARESQDVWIVGKRPVPTALIEGSGFNLGLPGCDNRIAALLSENNFNPYNPCLDIKCYHKHSSDFRTYGKEDRIRGKYQLLETSYL